MYNISITRGGAPAYELPSGAVLVKKDGKDVAFYNSKISSKLILLDEHGNIYSSKIDPSRQKGWVKIKEIFPVLSALEEVYEHNPGLQSIKAAITDFKKIVKERNLEEKLL